MINSVDARGNTALHYAAKYDDLDFADYLCQKGCKVETRNVYGSKPFDVAIRYNQIQLADLLYRRENKLPDPPKQARLDNYLNRSL